jgi:hypothetical protein
MMVRTWCASRLQESLTVLFNSELEWIQSGTEDSSPFLN